VFDTCHVTALTGRQFAILLAAAVRAHPATAYPRVMTRLLPRVLDEPSLEHQDAEQLRWFTELIAGAASHAGPVLLKFRHVTSHHSLRILIAVLFLARN
jgi:hypothetical protein